MPTRIVEVIYGLVALAALVVIMFESVEDWRIYQAYLRIKTDGVALDNARFRLWQDAFGALTQFMMMCAAGFALSQNYLGGSHPNLATALISSLVIAELAIVLRVFRRRRMRPRVARAMELADEAAKAKGEVTNASD